MSARKWLTGATLALGLVALPAVASADNYGAFPRPALLQLVAPVGSNSLSSSNRVVTGNLRSGQSVSYQISYTPGMGADGGTAPWLLSLRSSINPAYPGALSFTATDSTGAVIGTSAPAAQFATPDVADPNTDVAGIINGYFVTQTPGPVTVTIANFQPSSADYTLSLFPA